MVTSLYQIRDRFSSFFSIFSSNSRYNKVLEKSEKTSTLFDKVQLKSFIEGETDENAVENIGIKACGIQSDNLMGVDLPTDTDTPEELKTKLKSIYNICARQNGQVVIE